VFVRVTPSAAIPVNDWVSDIPSFHDFVNTTTSAVDAPAQFEARFQEIVDYFPYANQMLDDFRSIVASLRSYKAPLLLLDETQLTQALTTIRGNISNVLLTPAEDLQRLLSGPFTFAKNDDFVLSICLMYFPLTRASQYELIHTDSFPVWDGNSWLQYQLAQSYFLSSASAHWPLSSGSEMFHCSELQDPYTLCFFHKIPSDSLDPCSLALVHKNFSVLTSKCKFSRAHSIPSQTVQINSHQWVYALSRSGGQVQESCPSSAPQVFLLPPNGLLTFRSSCVYDFVNGPFSASMMPYTPDYRITLAPSPFQFPTQPVPVQPLFDHLHSNYLLYVLILSSTSTLLFVTLICSLFYFRCRDVRHDLPLSTSPTTRRSAYSYHPPSQRSGSTIPLALEYPQY
jgi:hypothetical protein